MSISSAERTRDEGKEEREREQEKEGGYFSGFDHSLYSSMRFPNMAPAHQYSSRQVDGGEEQDRLQPREGIHFPAFLLHL